LPSSLRIRSFCVLDEVDAALDEANVGRFTTALTKLAERTQFIVVTHNRRTIEVADAIYGVAWAATASPKSSHPSRRPPQHLTECQGGCYTYLMGQITVTISDESQQALEAEARRQGVSLDTAVERPCNSRAKPASQSCDSVSRTESWPGKTPNVRWTRTMPSSGPSRKCGNTGGRNESGSSPLTTAIIDTNVYLSGIARADGAPARIVRSSVSGSLETLLSRALLDEYREVTQREKSRRFHKLNPAELDGAIDRFVAACRMVEPPEAGLPAPEPDDQHLWDLLLASPRAVLITDDRLLRDHPPPGREVLSPREFVDRYLAEPAS
jgi:predicted nucleic acid-binding protein